MKKLLAFVLSISSVSFLGAAPQSATKDSPKPDTHQAFVPHRDIPKDCRQIFEADGSVLVTCDCENCGQPEAKDGPHPVPWSCAVREEGLSCGYGVGDVIETGSREKSKI